MFTNTITNATIPAVKALFQNDFAEVKDISTKIT
jgi:hypothetical protein